MYKQLSDAQLLKAVAQADHAAFTELVHRHTKNYFALAYRTLGQSVDAEDIVQMAFIKLWQNPSSWDASKSAFTTWFYRVVLNLCHDWQRSNSKVVSVDMDQLNSLLELSGAESSNQSGSSEQDVLQDNQQQLLQRHYVEYAIAQLPTSQRDALNLVVYMELPQKKVSQIMGVNLKALESLLTRARKSLVKKVSALTDKENSPKLRSSRTMDVKTEAACELNDSESSKTIKRAEL